MLKRVLVVSWRATRSETIAKALDKHGLEMVAFESVRAAARGLAKTPAGAVLIEVTGDDPALVPLIQQIRADATHASIPVILVVADPSSAPVAEAIAAGATEALPRSSSTQAIVESLRGRMEAAEVPATPPRSRKGAGPRWCAAPEAESEGPSWR